MAPLVPDIISNEFNFIIAILIGIAFGYILEQAGFSSSKKLVGLFYGYDFTVLRVFFTAGITAMFGVVVLGHFGLLDISIIYINPTYLWSAIVGGVIMGLGFVIGGFCPGTSVCAAAIGKIDAMIFIVGSIIGVFVFSELYPILEGLYKSEYWGNVRIFEVIGISQGLFSFLMILMAVFAFVVTTIIEKKVNKKDNPDLKPTGRYVTFAAITIIIGLFSFALPERQKVLIEKSNNPDLLATADYKIMTADELAYRLMYDMNSFRIYDLRSKELFNQFSLPNSMNISLDYIFSKDASKLFTESYKMQIFVDETEEGARRGAFLAAEMGYENIYVLKGGLNEFRSEILEFKKPNRELTLIEKDNYRFREIAQKEIKILIEKAKTQQKQEAPKTKRVLGGC